IPACGFSTRKTRVNGISATCAYCPQGQYRGDTLGARIGRDEVRCPSDGGNVAIHSSRSIVVIGRRLPAHFGQPTMEKRSMSMARNVCLGLLALSAAVMTANTPAAAQQPQQKPNILFIMGDDIGWMQPSIYHRGLMVGETPNIDRIGTEGAIFMD